MSRVILILTMVTSQLACPLVCLSAAAHQQSICAPAPVCPCCRKHAEPFQELPPASSDVEFGDCICNGAVLPSPIIVDADEHWTDLYVPAGDTTTAASPSGCRKLVDSFPGFCSAPPGRALRVALHSWQL